MRTSLLETRRIEKFLLQQGDLGDRLVLETQAQLNPDLAQRVGFQNQTYQLVETYGRQKLRKEIRQIDARMFAGTRHVTFLQKILSYFK